MKIYLYISNCKALLDTNFWFYEYIVFYTLSMPLKNCNSNVVKLRGSGKCHTELIWPYSSTFKRLPLNLIDRYSKHDFDRKSSSAQFEGNGRIFRTQIIEPSKLQIICNSFFQQLYLHSEMS